MRLSSLVYLILFALGTTQLVAQVPSFEWAKNYYIDTDFEGKEMTVDHLGNTYITGKFAGTVDFDPNGGTQMRTCVGQANGFLTKLDPQGNHAWTATFSCHYVYGREVETDQWGNVYLTGLFQGTCDFDPSPNSSFTLISETFGSTFITKLRPNGDFVWAKGYSGRPKTLTLDSIANVFSVGWFDAPGDFDPGPATFTMTPVGMDVSIQKLDSNGTFVWAKQISGSGDCDPYGVVSDVFGNIFITGSFHGVIDFDTSPLVMNITSPSNASNSFVFKADRFGNLDWVRTLSSLEHNRGYDIDVDGMGNVYYCGGADGIIDMDPGLNTYPLGSTNLGLGFVSKLDSNGAFLWAINVCDQASPTATSIALDRSGDIYITGVSDDGDFDPGQDIFT